ncbi:hypothetical protein DB31_2548 [Hyalangium minutum]|uniref:Uncharacterized protein n=1 Tax=Hyalangium minutum TaxID=394096 RepID=A0A085W6W7_9BACT|nr:hypothetical protein DB31_2548 [Hyalangium minutum]
MGCARRPERVAVVGRFRGVRESTIRATLTDPPESGEDGGRVEGCLGRRAPGEP